MMFLHAPAESAAARWHGVIAGILFALLSAGAWGAICLGLVNSFGTIAAWLPFTALMLVWGFLIWSRRRRAR